MIREELLMKVTRELNTVRHTVEVYGDSRLMDYFDAMPLNIMILC